MKMHVLSGGRLQMRKSVFFPDADRTETIELPVSAFLLCHPQGNVLFDTGCHPSAAERAEERWGGLAKLMAPVSHPGDNVIQGLHGLGMTAGDIDLVIASHFHPDHCGCNEFFRRASVLCHAKELAAARAPESEKQGYLKADWNASASFDEVNGARDVFGDGRIVVIPLPGHTPGTMGALISLDRSGCYLLASDAASFKAFLDSDIIPKNIWDKEEFSKSVAEIRFIEKGGATVICGHDGVQWAALKKGADAYD
jgi:glyoxylase-like metal-dependent hydrolase (beta-lactamase superfamily II)